MKSNYTISTLFLTLSLVIAGCPEETPVDEITAYEDNDGDGFGDAEKEVSVEKLVSGVVLDQTDCNDTDANINPDALEIPDNEIDENCDGKLGSTWYEDSDKDGFGNEKKSMVSSVAPEGYVGNAQDCDDLNKDINPDAKEVKGNSVDEDCDGIAKAAVCGDGQLDVGEVCDDGNTTLGDGCNNTCDSNETCGNGILDAGEVCDDGNTTLGDGCNDACTSDETCGNGVLDAGEECDDGNTTPGDGCDNFCGLEPVCGNDVTENGETCDDGNTTPGDGCSSVCQIEVCGNGIKEGAEECDDGNLDDTDGCTQTCIMDSDGDGIPDSGEFPGCEFNPSC